MRRSIVIGLLLLQLGACIVIFGGQERVSHARKAQKFRDEQKYDEAIREYQEHITARLADEKKEPDENPYFYEILIGDVYVDKNEPELALEFYLKALQHDVEKPLASDRIRRVAKFYAAKGKFKVALKILHQYRELDEFLFDGDIDDVAKQMVKVEDG